MKILTALTLLLFLTSCASTPRKRFLYGTGIGLGVGALGGAAFSPNQESKGVNALVFGLFGAVAGGVAGLFLKDDSELPAASGSLEERELGKEFLVPQGGNLPSFVRERLEPVVIEEHVERDSISEDGSLREPHRVWRIKRQAELSPKPVSNLKENPSAKGGH